MNDKIHRIFFDNNGRGYSDARNNAMLWSNPPRHIEDNFNPCIRDLKGLNYFETYFQHHVGILKSLLYVDITLFQSYMNKLTSIWRKVPSDYIKKCSDLIGVMYLKGIRDVSILSLDNLISYSEENKPYFHFIAMMHGQFENRIVNIQELFTDEIRAYIHMSRQNTDMCAIRFLDELDNYRITNLLPYPEELMPNSQIVLQKMLTYYRDKFFIWFHELFANNIETILIYAVSENIDIPSSILNDYYERYPLLPHFIIRHTSDATTCSLYLFKIRNFKTDVKDENGRTAAMNFIAKYKEEPIEAMIHDPEITDSDGKTCQDLWKMHIGNDNIPLSIRIKAYTELTQGCDHFDRFEYMFEDKLYCEDCSKNISDRVKVFMSSSCPICYTEYTNATVFGKYKHCSHVLCESCAKRTTECPFCRV